MYIGFKQIVEVSTARTSDILTDDSEDEKASAVVLDFSWSSLETCIL